MIYSMLIVMIISLRTFIYELPIFTYINKLNVNECESHTFILTYVVVSMNSQPDKFWHHLGDKAPGIPLRNYLASGHACN